MANSLLPVTELDFAEFTGGLISQTLDAVISSYADQERKCSEIRRIAALSPAAYAREFGSESEATEELVNRFPPTRNTSFKSAVDANAPYTPVSKDKVEKPAIKKLCGYEMVANKDYKTVLGKVIITKTGYAAILQTIAVDLISANYTVVQSMTAKGLPKVLVDNGRIASKLVFKIYDPEVANSAQSKATIPIVGASQTPLRKFMVSPVHAKGPEYLSLKADIVGEVEITFKTIIE